MKKLVILAVFISFLAISSEKAVAEGRLIVADFNKGEDKTNLGTELGAWDKDPADLTQSCTIGFVPGKDDMALKITYDVDSHNPAYNGIWMKLGDLKAGQYENLVFDVKGDLSGCTSVFRIELKNGKGANNSYLVTGVTNDWTTKVIPLSTFRSTKNLGKLKELVFVFDDTKATKKTGVLYVDNIAFE